MYHENFHEADISSVKFLITGGAGFIGSNIVEYLVHHKAGLIRIFDNLSEGKIENIEPFLKLDNVEFIEGDIGHRPFLSLSPNCLSEKIIIDTCGAMNV